MSDRPFLIVSDVHLGAVPEETERAFRDFLAAAARESSGLLINGDLFDFWFEYHTVVPSRHYRVLAALADVVDAGVPVWFVGGNHDAWGGDFLRREVGVEVVSGPLRMELAGRRALVAHGDGVGGGDLGYRALKRFIRHPVTVGAFRLLHPDWGAWIAGRASSTEEKERLQDPRAAGRAAYIRRWAAEQIERDPSLDLVVAGHSHQPEVEEIAPGRFFVNSGDWIHHRSYVRLPADRAAPELLSW
ncbi:MAG TPA: UDP-2,3-diacylglucosamine diphosphatase [Longimicrobiaceae bacterium]|nr:UDP-2,3-diacylglucosamine diphosphatase [Longimicrobiaceae bacterium]